MSKENDYELWIAWKTKWYAESFVRRHFGRNISWNQLFAILWYLLRQIATDNFGNWAIFALQKLLEHSEMIKDKTVLPSLYEIENVNFPLEPLNKKKCLITRKHFERWFNSLG